MTAVTQGHEATGTMTSLSWSLRGATLVVGVLSR